MLWGSDFEISEQIHEIWKNLFNKILDDLIENQSVNFSIISSQECLSLPKDSELHHYCILSIQDVNSVLEY